MFSNLVVVAGKAKNAGWRWYPLFLGVVCLGLATEVILLAQRNRMLSAELDRVVNELIRVDIQGRGSSSAGIDLLGNSAPRP